ncbi:MAG: uracil-DNA glycosylase [Bacilli bacterium]|nr:uracil-DNA glycosylase [Bacilli bacterium]
MNLIGNKWDEILREEYQKEYFRNIVLYINKAYKEREIFPPKSYILRALSLTDYDEVKVVILGQDPYHGIGEANGLAFAVNRGIKLPPSLMNIYKELNSDLEIPISDIGDLTCWAKEGVLLLNSVLTVEKDKPASHKNLGWEKFTDAIISRVNEKENPVVFILWGNFAKSKKKLITNSKHFVIESSHPSPFSCNYGFFGSKPFSRTNKFLKENNINEIDFRVK